MADTFKIKIAGETQQFENSMANLNSAMKNLKSEGKSLNNSLKIDPSNANNAKSLYTNLQQQLSVTQEKAKKTKAALEKMDPKVNMSSFVRATNQLRNMETETQKLKQQLDTTFNADHSIKVSIPRVNGSAITTSVSAAATEASDTMADTFNGGTSRIKSMFTSMGEHLKSSMSSPISFIKGGLAGIAGGALLKVGSSIASGIGNGVKDVMGSMQETQTAANGLKKVMDFTGTNKEFKKTSQSLSQTAIDTNISTKDADSFASTLLAIGKDSSSTAKLVDAAAKSNQAFGGSGEAFTSVSTAMGQMNSSGKVSAENMNQITDANSALGAALKSQVFENYQKAGGSAKSFNEATASGKISVNDLNTAMMQVGEKGGTAIKTLPDSMDSLKESISTKLQPAFDFVSQGFAGMVTSASDWVSNINFDWLTGILDKLKPLLDPIKKYISDDFGAIGEVFNSIKNTLSKLIGTLMDKAAPGFNKFKKAITPLLQSIGGVFKTLGDVLKNVGHVMSWLVDKIITPVLMPIFTALGTVLSGFFKVLGDIMNAITNIINGANKIVKKVGKFFGGLFNSGDVDSKVKNIDNEVNNSSSVSNATNTFNITNTNGLDMMTLARKIASLIKAGAV